MQAHYIPGKFNVKKKSWKSRPESWVTPPTQHMLLSRSSFLRIPPPTHSPAVTGCYYNGTCGWTLREDWETRESPRHKTSKLVSSTTESEELRPDFWCLGLSGRQNGWACRGWQRWFKKGLREQMMLRGGIKGAYWDTGRGGKWTRTGFLVKGQWSWGWWKSDWSCSEAEDSPGWGRTVDARKEPLQNDVCPSEWVLKVSPNLQFCWASSRPTFSASHLTNTITFPAFILLSDSSGFSTNSLNCFSSPQSSSCSTPTTS